MRIRRVLLIMVVIMAAAGCGDDDPVDTGIVPPACSAGQRRVLFRMLGAADVARCVEFDTLVAGTAPECSVVVWTAPANGRHDEGFRYEGTAGATNTACGTGYFFGVTQNSVGGYTFFDGIVRRPFDSGPGPFATGTYEVINYQQTLVDIGHFEFWE